MAVYKPACPTASHRRLRTTVSSSLLACFHSSHDVPTLLNLVEAVIQQLSRPHLHKSSARCRWSSSSTARC
jgi:hypothetical protein